MGNELLASKVVLQEEEPRIRAIQGGPTAVTAAFGVTERGPVGVPVLTTNFEDWRKIFGGYVADSDLALSVAGFYQNHGNARLWTVRVVHYTDIDDATTLTSAASTVTLQTGSTAPSSGSVLSSNAAPFDLEPGDTILVALNGGGPLTGTFTATAGVRTAVNAGPYDLTNAGTLLVAVDGGAPQTIAFATSQFSNIDAATATEVAAVVNAGLNGGFASVFGGALRITSDRRGSGSSINVTGGTDAAAFAFPAGVSAGTGNVANIDAVSAAEVVTILEAAVAGATITSSSGRILITSDTTGGSSSIQVTAASTADDELGFDNAIHTGGTGAAVDTLQFDGKTDGTFGDEIRLVVEAATNGNVEHFNLFVQRNNVTIERWPNLTMDPDADRHVETIVNDEDTGSDYVVATDLEAAGSATERRPATAASALMTGGDDGLVGLGDIDFIGSSAELTGFRALDQTLGIRILIAPGRATSAVQNAMISYAEITRNMEMFAILDPPEGLTAVAMQTYAVSTASLRGVSEFGAIYWPRIKVLNPNKTVFGQDPQLVCPPSGHIAGMYARTDASAPGGVYIPPAGEETGKLVGAVGLETEEVLDEGKRDLVFPDLINPIAQYPGTAIHCDGARTLKDNGNFPTIGERRGVIYIEQSVKDFLRVFKHKNNNERTRAQVERSVTAFLLLQMSNEAFQTKVPATAFFVDASAALNPPSVIFARQMRIRLGLATNKPAEFIILSVSQDTRALEEELAAA